MTYEQLTDSGFVSFQVLVFDLSLDGQTTYKLTSFCGLLIAGGNINLTYEQLTDSGFVSLSLTLFNIVVFVCTEEGCSDWLILN